MEFRNVVAVIICGMLGTGVWAQERQGTSDAVKVKSGEAVVPVSFKGEVLPILKKHCLPCHAEADANPSELSLDNFRLLMQGGRKGGTVVPGKPAESSLVSKLGERPPFGDRMPLNSRKKVKEGKAKWLSADEVKAIATWVSQGAKDN